MNLTAPFAGLLLALTLSMPATAAEDASHFLLTPTLVAKFKAAGPDLRSIEHRKDDADESDQSIEGMVKKIEREPAAKAVLIKHGLSPREFALATFAMMHAGFYVAMEKTMDKKKGAELYATYTREQKANIALMRSFTTAQTKTTTR